MSALFRICMFWSELSDCKMCYFSTIQNEMMMTTKSSSQQIIQTAIMIIFGLNGICYAPKLKMYLSILKGPWHKSPYKCVQWWLYQFIICNLFINPFHLLWKGNIQADTCVSQWVYPHFILYSRLVCLAPVIICTTSAPLCR